MNHKSSNTWQKTMYGPFSTKSLDSPLSHKQAREQVKFLIQTLGLKKEASILDIPCGTGRYTLALAKEGFSVVGVDINTVCLKTAQENCQSINNVQIKRGDMKKTAWARGKFDIVLNMFTSFGYFKTDRENAQILKEFVQALKPGGKIIIQTINRNWILSRFSPVSWEETPQLHIMPKREYHPKTKSLEAHQAFLCKKSKMWEKSYHRVRLYSIPEMKTLEEPSNKTFKIPHRPIYVAEVSK